MPQAYIRPTTLMCMKNGQKSKGHQLAHHQLMSQQGPHFSPHSTAVSSGIGDVVITSVYSEKTCLKKLMMMMKMNIIIMNKLAVARN